MREYADFRNQLASDDPPPVMIRAVDLAVAFIEVFIAESRRLAPNESLYCAVGIASGVIESFYPQTYPKEYDIFGRALTLATRYEAAKKELFNHLDRSNRIILQEFVSIGLSPATQQSFQKFELKSFRIRDDRDAEHLYSRIIDHSSEKTSLSFANIPETAA